MKFKFRAFNRLLRPAKMMKAGKAMQKKMQRAVDSNLFFDPVVMDAFYDQAAGFMAAHAPAASTGKSRFYKGEFVAGSFSNVAGSSAYKLYIPSTYSAGQKLPLVVMLHGCTQNADDFAAGTRMNDVAEEHSCFVLYPEQDKKHNGRACWNWFKPQHQAHDAGEPFILAGMTRRVAQEYAIDARRIYIAGLSAGGAMTAIMGAAYPELYAAIGIHSGLAYQAAHDLPSAVKAMAGGSKRRDTSVFRRFVPAIVFHGDRDGTVNVKNGDRIVSAAKSDMLHSGIKAKKQIETGADFTRVFYHDKDNKIWLEDWRVHNNDRGLDHSWSGGSNDGSYASASGPDAARAMLRFFLLHALSDQA